MGLDLYSLRRKTWRMTLKSKTKKWGKKLGKCDIITEIEDFDEHKKDKIFGGKLVQICSKTVPNFWTVLVLDTGWG